MQATTAQATSIAQASARPAGRPAAAANAYQGYQILRRNGAVVSFEPSKIAVALMKAFLAVHGTQGAASASVRETRCADRIIVAACCARVRAVAVHIRDIRIGRLGLMRGGTTQVARYRALPQRRPRSVQADRSAGGRAPRRDV
jgi:ribonucleoside-diphosphate reductase alpha chain